MTLNNTIAFPIQNPLLGRGIESLGSIQSQILPSPAIAVVDFNAGSAEDIYTLGKPAVLDLTPPNHRTRATRPGISAFGNVLQLEDLSIGNLPATELLTEIAIEIPEFIDRLQQKLAAGNDGSGKKPPTERPLTRDERKTLQEARADAARVAEHNRVHKKARMEGPQKYEEEDVTVMASNLDFVTWQIQSAGKEVNDTTLVEGIEAEQKRQEQIAAQKAAAKKNKKHTPIESTTTRRKTAGPDDPTDEKARMIDLGDLMEPTGPMHTVAINRPAKKSGNGVIAVVFVALVAAAAWFYHKIRSQSAEPNPAVPADKP